MELKSNPLIGEYVPKALIHKYRRPGPVHIFTRSPRSGLPLTATVDLGPAVEGRRVYVHAAYTVNLANGTRVDSLEAELVLARTLGMAGVVVHVGKALKTPVAEARAAMQARLHALTTAHPNDGRLILETAAGQGTELCHAWPDFVDMVLSVPGLRMCIDTCHVFAAGHDPVDVLQETLGRPALRARLALVHLNGSKGPLGCRVDRHAFPGDPGIDRIGQAKLQTVIDLCTRHGVDMISEEGLEN